MKKMLVVLNLVLLLMAVVLCVGALAVWYTLGKAASILAFAAACLGIAVWAVRNGRNAK